MGRQLKIVIYALGGGWGHVTRALGLARAFEALGYSARLLAPRGKGVTETPLVIPVSPSQTPELNRRLNQADLVIVDVFSRGVLGELQPRPEWVLLTRLAKTMPLPGYDIIIDIEPNLAWSPYDGFGPVAWRPKAVQADCVLVPCGRTFDGLFQKLQPRLAHCGYRVTIASEHPAALDGAQVVIGAAGYNLSYEAASVGAHHLCIPQRRRVDDQFRRARAIAETFRNPYALEQRALELLSLKVARPSVPVKTFDQLAQHILRRRGFPPGQSKGQRLVLGKKHVASVA